MKKQLLMTVIFWGCLGSMALASGIMNEGETTDPTIRNWAVGARFRVGEKCLYEEDMKIYECIQMHTIDAPNWTPSNLPSLWTYMCNTITVDWTEHYVTGGRLMGEFQKAIDIDISNRSSRGYEVKYVLVQGMDESTLSNGRIGRTYHTMLRIYDDATGNFEDGVPSRDEFLEYDFNWEDFLPNPNFGKDLPMRIAISKSEDHCYPYFLMKNGDIRLRRGTQWGPRWDLLNYHLPEKSRNVDISSNQQSKDVYVQIKENNGWSRFYHLNFWSNGSVFLNSGHSWWSCFDMKHNANNSIDDELVFYCNVSKRNWERFYQNGRYGFRRIGNSLKPQMIDISVQPATVADPVIWQIDQDNYLYYWDPIHKIWSMCLNGRFERIAVDSEGKPWAIHNDRVFQGSIIWK